MSNNCCYDLIKQSSTSLFYLKSQGSKPYMGTKMKFFFKTEPIFADHIDPFSVCILTEALAVVQNNK